MTCINFVQTEILHNDVQTNTKRKITDVNKGQCRGETRQCGEGNGAVSWGKGAQ